MKDGRKHPNILVVEDDPLFLESLAMLLEEEGFDVLAAPSAEKALEAAADRHFDLIITDVRMPGMDGITMLDRVRRSSPESRAIVITGYSEFQVPVEAIRIPIDDFIPKPFDKQAFLSSVRRSLEWIEREQWWEHALSVSQHEAREAVGWMLPRMGPIDPTAHESWLRRREVLCTGGRLLGLGADDLEALSWADWLISECSPEAAQSLRRHVEGPFAPVGIADETAPRAPQSPSGRSLHGSVRALLHAALGHALALRQHESGDIRDRTPVTPSYPVRWLQAVRAVMLPTLPDHAPEDASTEPSTSLEGRLSDLRGRWDGPPEILEALARALAPPLDPQAEDSGGVLPAGSLMALGMSYLHGGRTDMARDVLARALAAPAASAALVSRNTAPWLWLALAHSACGDPKSALEAADHGLGLADTAIEEAEALAVRGAVQVAAGITEGVGEIEEAAGRFALHGARRGEVRCWLLLAWAWSRRPGARAKGLFHESLGRLLDAVEGSGLEWTLRRDRWLSVQALKAARQAGIETERAARWLARLDAEEDLEALPEALLRVDGFGRLTLRVGQREVREDEWKTSKSKWLFVVLLLHGGRELPDERLMDLFWESHDADRARQNLYSTLTYVRRALSGGDGLPADPVVHRRGHCQFNTAVPHRVDFLEFDEKVRKGLALWERGDGAGAVPHLVGALDLYQGDLLENHDEPWMQAYRRHYRDRALQALEYLLSHHLRTSDRVAAVATAERLLSVDPCHQGAYQCLMRSAIAAGQPERAARLYRACVRALRDDLQMAPSAQTMAVYQEVLKATEPGETLA